MDLGEVTQQKMAIENQIGQLEQYVEEVRREAQLEVTEAEMSMAGLQGELCALREEVEAGQPHAAPGAPKARLPQHICPVRQV